MSTLRGGIAAGQRPCRVIRGHRGSASTGVLPCCTPAPTPRLSRRPRSCRIVGRTVASPGSKIAKRRRQVPLTGPGPAGDWPRRGRRWSVTPCARQHARTHPAARRGPAPQRRPQAGLAASGASRLDGVRIFLTDSDKPLRRPGLAWSCAATSGPSRSSTAGRCKPRVRSVGRLTMPAARRSGGS